MKKIIAAIVAVVLVMSLSIAAFAEEIPSASGKVYHKVTVINGIGAAQDVKSVEDGNAIALAADTAKGAFKQWMIYKADGSAAVAGVDYTVSAGALKEAALTIVPKTDLIVTGNYDGKLTDPKTGSEATSPVTGDFNVVYLGIAAFAALACAAASKKQLAK